MKTALPFPLLALVATASAQIDAGGGKSLIGTMTNHGSIVGIVASAPQPIGSMHKRCGQPIKPEPDADGHGIRYGRE